MMIRLTWFLIWRGKKVIPAISPNHPTTRSNSPRSEPMVTTAIIKLRCKYWSRRETVRASWLLGAKQSSEFLCVTRRLLKPLNSGNGMQQISAPEVEQKNWCKFLPVPV